MHIYRDFASIIPISSASKNPPPCKRLAAKTTSVNMNMNARSTPNPPQFDAMLFGLLIFERNLLSLDASNDKLVGEVLGNHLVVMQHLKLL